MIYIFLPVHNRIEATKKFVDCLLSQELTDYHLILIDDGSTDNTFEMVKEKINNLTVISGDGNLWWAGSLHKAYLFLKEKGITGDDYVLFLAHKIILNQYHSKHPI